MTDADYLRSAASQIRQEVGPRGNGHADRLDLIADEIEKAIDILDGAGAKGVEEIFRRHKG